MTTRRAATTPPPNELNALLQRLGEDDPPAQRSLLQSFGRIVLARVPPEYLRTHAGPELARDVLSAFELLGRTPPRGTGVRVRPDPERLHRAVVEAVMSDRPFIVDTILELLAHEGLEIDLLLHPVLTVERDREGRVTAIEARTAEGLKVSVTTCAVRGHVDAGRAADLEGKLRACLEDVRLATDDFELMAARLEGIAGSLRRLADRLPERKEEIAEILEFLRWIRERGFLFLGCRGYDVVRLGDGQPAIAVERGSGLGILRREERSSYWEPHPLDTLSPDLRRRILEGPLLIVTKSNSESPVRRRDRMDYIGIKKLDEHGAVMGEHRFLGLFTRKASAEPAGQIPILRQKLERVLAAEGAAQRSHDYESIFAIFHSMPKEELFLVSVDELREDIAHIREAEGTGEVRLRARPDALGRGTNVLVILPARAFSEEAHRKIREELVRTFDGVVLYDHLALVEGEVSRIHFYLAAPRDRLDPVDIAELEGRIARHVVSWENRLSELLRERHRAELAHRLADRYASAFSPEYMATADPETALSDIERLEVVRASGQMQLALSPHPEAEAEASCLRIFLPRGQLILADLIATLDNLGIRVVEADAMEVAEGTSHAVTIHSFIVQGPDRRALDAERVEPLLSSALPAIRSGIAQDYPLNRLIVSALLTWQEVSALMAYSGYAFQTLAVSSRKALVDALTHHPKSARRLVEIFRAKFDPSRSGDRAKELERCTESYVESLREVESIPDDRTLRRLQNLVQATVRTNYFQSRARSRAFPFLALKFECAAVETMPRPRPAYDIYLYSVPFEGVHSRRGNVARGGIRWSNRSDDFRTEVLGLVKTQNVKNAVIVPAGAKGAFVLRNPPTDRAALREQGLTVYESFIRGLLDVTDNIVGGHVVHPPETVVYDGEDPYLVVAADKGTATFSDPANAISAEYGFWLGDAFASGGSHGYDHKKLGITARGVWECVRRHFREIGKEIERDPITVVGIGDMSGDVFGNGMLLSRTLKLAAAFDHRSVFIDPNPDPEASYRERKRLFELPGSSWEDYDRSLLSPGAGVYKRGAKEIRLSEEARTLLDITEPVVNGETLIKAVLRAPLDLLWNGGIGTYVKASWETHAEVGDAGNDSVRVDANEVRAAVVGEGGNLGFTQPARVEYSLRGGRGNTDAVDNSAGVDLSDHEVNLKILLRPLLEREVLSRADRDALLQSAVAKVTRDVLSNSHSQSRALSLELLRAHRHLGDFRDLMVHLQRRGRLDRALEALPDSEELKERGQAGQELTRPELAVLLAYAKMDLKQEIIDSTLPDEPALVSLLRDYFPETVRKRVDSETLEQHPLRRQIIATVLTNAVVDLMGATFALRVARDTGAPPSAVIRGWFAAAEIADLPELLARIRGLEAQTPTSLEYAWLLDLEASLERATRWTVDGLSQTLPIDAIVNSQRGPVQQLREKLGAVLAESQGRALGTALPAEGDGFPDPELAERIAGLRSLDELMEITRIAREVGQEPLDVAHMYHRLGEVVELPWLAQQIDLTTEEDPWARRARQTLARDLRQARRKLVLSALELARDGASVDEGLARFQEQRAEEITLMRSLILELRQAERVSLAALIVAVREISGRAGAG